MPQYIVPLKTTLGESGQGSGTPERDMNHVDDETQSNDPFLAMLAANVRAKTNDPAANAMDAPHEKRLDELAPKSLPKAAAQTAGPIKLPPREKDGRRALMTNASIRELNKQIKALGPVQPFKNAAKKNPDGTIPVAPSNKNFYPDILALGDHYGFKPGKPNTLDASIMGGIHPGGDKVVNGKRELRDPHHFGIVVDFSLKGKDDKPHSDEEIDYFIHQALANGYSVEDARDQNGNRHLHVQSEPLLGGRYIYIDDHHGGHASTPPSRIQAPPRYEFDPKTKKRSTMRDLPVPPAYQHLDGPAKTNK